MAQYLAKIRIKLKEGILDVQGKAVEHALHAIEFPMMSEVKIGKYAELNVDADSKDKAYELVKSASDKLIANPIIEEYDIEIVEG